MAGSHGSSSTRARSWWPGPRLVSLLVGGGAAVLVLYPIAYLIQASLSVGDPQARPPEAYGLDNFTGLGRYAHILGNTLQVAAVATVLAVVVGFVMGWILSRTNVPGRTAFEQLMAMPYYVTPLMGALAWAIIASPTSGFVNQLWRALGGDGHLIDINSSWGIAWVMALFEGSVAFVMIGAVMKSMDPSMEEASQVLGAGRTRTMLRITLPLVLPGVLGAAVYVFAEMLGSFSAALVLGLPARFYVVTTAMYQMVSQYPPRFPTAAAMGVSLFAVMFAMVWIYRRIISSGTYVTITGKAFRPRVMDVGSLRWPFLAICIAYLTVAVILPVLTIVYASFQHLGAVAPRLSNFTLANYTTALSLDAVRSALWNSLLLGFATASIGIVLMGFLSWLIYRSRLPGAGAIEYLLMFPQAVPRLVFAFGMMWAWLVFPIPIYGTLWLLLIAYLTVFMPLGLRTISGVILQIDRSLEVRPDVRGDLGLSPAHRHPCRCSSPASSRRGSRCSSPAFASWARRLLMGPKSKVITPAIVSRGSRPAPSSRRLWRCCRRWRSYRLAFMARRAVRPQAVSVTRPDRGARPGRPLWCGPRGSRRDVHRRRRRASRCSVFRLRQDGTLRAIAGLERPIRRDPHAAAPYLSSPSVNVPAERRGLSMVFQSYAIWPHMSVFDNVAYGLRGASVPRPGGHAARALDLVQLGDLGAAAPRSSPAAAAARRLRAFVFQPSVLLFDEPLSNLDAKLRAEMRVELKVLQRRLDITSVYVTHDLEEALAISDRIVVMRDGVIEQVGTPGEIYDRPRNTFVADFVGSANLIRGRRRTDLERDGLVVIETPSGALVHGTAGERAAGAEALMAVRTVRLRLDRARPAAAVNVWPARVRQRVFQGDFTQYHVEWDGRMLIVRSAAPEPLAEGEEVFVSAEPRHCVLLED